MKKEYFCPQCRSALHDQAQFDAAWESWVCEACDTPLQREADGTYVICEDAFDDDIKVLDHRSLPEYFFFGEGLKKRPHWELWLTRLRALFGSRKAIEIIHGSKTLCGKNVKDVCTVLRNHGFCRVQAVKAKEAGNGEVVQVLIEGNADFDAGSLFPYDAAITVTYREKK